MSKAASSRLLELIKDKSEDGTNIKLSIKKRGCNGLTYTLEYIKEKEHTDEVLEQFGAKLFIDEKAIEYLNGSYMDYIDTPTRQEFVFSNPNAKGLCGCGESFTI